jgi:hypothetical protein
MGIRRLNYTGRKKIKRADATFVIRERTDGPPAFDATLRLADYQLPGDALVFVEVYRRTTWMRFPFGSAGRLVLPPADQCVLSEFDTTDNLLFRVKVTSSEGRHGVLLAEADGIRACLPDEVEDDRQPLLLVRPADLGDEVWRLDFSGSEVVLLIDRSVGDWRAAANLPAFRALVCPAAMRQILTRFSRDGFSADDDDPTDKKSCWLRFAAGLPGVGDAPEGNDEGEVEEWIDRAVAAFARLAKSRESFAKYLQSEDHR